MPVDSKVWLSIMTAPATVAASFNSEALEATSNETAIHYSRPATIFAAVAASIFTFVGITGKKFLINYSYFFKKLPNFEVTAINKTRFIQS